MLCQVVFGCSLTKLIRTMDFTLLKPYFHGTTNRSGAPFWFGNSRPYIPTARMANGFMASSNRKPSTYGQSIKAKPERCPGMTLGSCRVSKRMYLALDVGSTCFSNAEMGKPIHGMTIDQASTQRNR
ncbi:hypothetical protein D3C78_1422920 [compost metagenome]